MFQTKLQIKKNQSQYYPPITERQLILVLSKVIINMPVVQTTVAGTT
jgi:hypothetical protein